MINARVVLPEPGPASDVGTSRRAAGDEPGLASARPVASASSPGAAAAPLPGPGEGSLGGPAEEPPVLESSGSDGGADGSSRGRGDGGGGGGGGGGGSGGDGSSSEGGRDLPRLPLVLLASIGIVGAAGGVAYRRRARALGSGADLPLPEDGEAPQPGSCAMYVADGGDLRTVLVQRPGGKPAGVPPEDPSAGSAQDKLRRMPFWIRAEKAVEHALLPAGYPDSTAAGYTTFILWRMFQRTASATMECLATQSLLLSVGMGGAAAGKVGRKGLSWSSIGVGVAVQWVLKDGMGKLAKLFCAAFLGRGYDADTKKWRMRSSFLYHCGTALEMATPLAPSYFLLLASLANICKQAAIVSAGATRAAIYRAFALRENVGDLTAKGEAQIVLSELAGLGIGIAFAQALGGSAAAAIRTLVFPSLFAIDMLAHYEEMKAVCFTTLNRERAQLAAASFLASAGEGGAARVATPAEVCRREGIVLPASFRGPQLQLGARMRDAVADSRELSELIGTFAHERYLLNVRGGRVHVVLQPGASADDTLKAILHAGVLRESWDGRSSPRDAVRDSYAAASKAYPGFREALREAGWNVKHLTMGPTHYDALWSTTGALPAPAPAPAPTLGPSAGPAPPAPAAAAASRPARG
eukprot:tig00000670_g3032.t1